jgi:hypothetical protein
VPAYGSPQKGTAATGLLPRQFHGLATCVSLSAGRARDKLVNSSDSLRTKPGTGILITTRSSLQYYVSVVAISRINVPPILRAEQRYLRRADPGEIAGCTFLYRIQAIHAPYSGGLCPAGCSCPSVSLEESITRGDSGGSASKSSTIYRYRDSPPALFESHFRLTRVPKSSRDRFSRPDRAVQVPTASARGPTPS